MEKLLIYGNSEKMKLILKFLFASLFIKCGIVCLHVFSSEVDGIQRLTDLYVLGTAIVFTAIGYFRTQLLNLEMAQRIKQLEEELEMVKSTMAE